MKNTIFGPIIKIYIVIFILLDIFLILAFASKKTYNSNEFILKLNNEPFYYIYREYEKNVLFKNNKICSNQPKENTIYDNQSVNLELKEYEVKDNNNIRISGKFTNIISTKYQYNEVINPITMKIKKNNKIIYEGKYISDLTSLITEEGRYYIHLYITRKESTFKKVYTELSANFVYNRGKENDNK